MSVLIAQYKIEFGHIRGDLKHSRCHGNYIIWTGNRIASLKIATPRTVVPKVAVRWRETCGHGNYIIWTVNRIAPPNIATLRVAALNIAAPRIAAPEVAVRCPKTKPHPR
jgi:hypothetical protein